MRVLPLHVLRCVSRWPRMLLRVGWATYKIIVNSMYTTLVQNAEIMILECPLLERTGLLLGVAVGLPVYPPGLGYEFSRK